MTRTVVRTSAGAGLTAPLLAIDLGNDGVTPNDPGDTDLGPNGLQNFPTLSTATTRESPTTPTTIAGTLSSAPNTPFRLDIYANAVGADLRAGELFLGSLQVATNSGGMADFVYHPATSVVAGLFVTATATRLADLDLNPATPLEPVETSEFSSGIVVESVAISSWQNPANARDTTNDGHVVPLDVLVLVNELNNRQFSHPVTGQLQPRPAEARFFYDVNGDGFAAPIDVLIVINFLNAEAAALQGEGEETPGGATCGDAAPPIWFPPRQFVALVGLPEPDGDLRWEATRRDWLFAAPSGLDPLLFPDPFDDLVNALLGVAPPSRGAC
jgi:hypothetical protein